MNQFGLVYNKVTAIKVKVKQNKPVMINVPKFNDGFFTGESLKYILERVKFLKKYYRPIKLNIILSIGKVRFQDKITILMLDMLLYDLAKINNWKVNVSIEVDFKNNAFNHSIKSTSLYRTAWGNGLLDNEAFLKNFEQLVITQEIYRRYVKREIFDKKPDIISSICSDIDTFLSGLFHDDKWIDEVCEAIAELIDNTYAHTESDCLIDINVGEFSDPDDKQYKMLNIAIINFAEKRIFDQIKENIIEKKYPEHDELYQDVYKAYDNHKIFFDEEYNEDDFFNITAFQNGVTTRRLNSGNSGTGLTSLLRNIVGKTQESYSYVLSGDNIIFFHDKYLEVNNRFIGFNEEKDYINSKPDRLVIAKSSLYIPGTFFHLSLLREKENE